MRTAPSEKPPAVQRLEEWTCNIRIELATRLFGGGARAREVDAISWLRSSAAKSALRAWWRAGNAHRFADLDALRSAEAALFGSPGRFDADGQPVGGPGALEVTVTKAPRPATLQTYSARPSDPLNIAYFPAAGMGQDAAKMAIPPASAALRLVSRDAAKAVVDEILSALRLWLVLGGAGARTRRGAGALAVSAADARKIGVPATFDELRTFLRVHCRRRLMKPGLDGLFSLARTRAVYLGPICHSAEAAQEKLLAALRAARQERRPGGSHQSDWPESDAIRIREGGRYVHPPLPKNAGQYPRAVLGLPIVLHYKDRAPAEPPDHQILAAVPDGRGWKKLERYSSPILLRPVRIVQRDQVRYVPVAVFTDCTLPSSARPLVLRDPKAAIQPRDVVDTYDLQAHAEATLSRIETFFATSLQERI